jgi:glutaredoxin-related protein
VRFLKLTNTHKKKQRNQNEESSKTLKNNLIQNPKITEKREERCSYPTKATVFVDGEISGSNKAIINGEETAVKTINNWLSK